MKRSAPASTSLCLPAAAVLLILLAGALPPQLAASASDDKKPPEGTALLYGTVFSRAGFAVRGATVRVRHKDDKKPKWKARTNRRGEFAIRLPRASGDYEVTVSAKGLQKETREFTITLEEKFNLYFRLESAKKEKK